MKIALLLCIGVLSNVFLTSESFAMSDGVRSCEDALSEQHSIRVVEYLSEELSSDSEVVGVARYSGVPTVFVSTHEAKLRLLRRYRMGVLGTPIDVILSHVEIEINPQTLELIQTSEDLLGGVNLGPIPPEVLKGLYTDEGLKKIEAGLPLTRTDRRPKAPEEKVTREVRAELATSAQSSGGLKLLLIYDDVGSSAELFDGLKARPQVAILKVGNLFEGTAGPAQFEILLSGDLSILFEILEDDRFILADIPL